MVSLNLLFTTQSFLTSAVWLLLLNHAHAQQQTTCSLLQAQGPDIEVTWPQQPDYTVINNDYWSTACAAQKPECIILPGSAQELSDVLVMLSNTGERFAVKSGGHSPNTGYASIDGGPLISMRRMNHVEYDAGSQSVHVGPGNDWQDVTKALLGTGVTIVGGRMGEVGVSGLTLGGGLSFLSGQQGWAANNMLEFEVVLADASIVKASSTENPDLFAALKGGGSSFGIVTNFVLRAIPQAHDVWGGVRVYAAEQTPKILEAVRSFTENYPDLKAGIIATADLTLANLLDIWVVFLFYDGPEPSEGCFELFDEIPHTLDLTQRRTFHDMLVFDNTFVLRGSVYTIATETMPVPNATVGAEVMQGIYDTWHGVASTAKFVPGTIASMALQPFPREFTKRANELGGVVMDFDEDVDRIIIELDYSHWFQADIPLIDRTTVNTYEALGNRVKEFQGQGKLPDVHLPLFMNDAYFRQDYWGRLRPETAAKYQAVREKYDPASFFSARTKGFHL